MISRVTARWILATLVLLAFSVAAPALVERWSVTLADWFPAAFRFTGREFVVGLLTWATMAGASLLPGALLELGLTVRGGSDRLDELLELHFLRGTSALLVAAGLSIPLYALRLVGGPVTVQNVSVIRALTAVTVCALLLHLGLCALMSERAWVRCADNTQHQLEG